MRIASNLFSLLLSIFVAGAVAGFATSSAYASGESWSVVKGTPGSAHIPMPERLIAFGDVHGDAEALLRIAREMKLVDASENWIGGKAVAINMGDVVDRGSESLRAMKLLMKWEKQAAATGGRVITLLGNHELLLLNKDFRHMTAKDAQAFRDEYHARNEGAKRVNTEVAIHSVMSDGNIGSWLRRRPVAIVVGETLFVHAGVEKWIGRVAVEDLNATASAWVEFFQTNTNEPPSETDWVITRDGPLWTRRIANGEAPTAKLDKWLDRAGLERVVVGHTVLKNGVPQLRHPTYGTKLMMIDTGISAASGGELSAIEFSGGSVRAHLMIREEIKIARTCRKAITE